MLEDAIPLLGLSIRAVHFYPLQDSKPGPAAGSLRHVFYKVIIYVLATMVLYYTILTSKLGY